MKAPPQRDFPPKGVAYPVGFAAAERDPEIVLFLGLVLGRDLNRQSPEMSVPGLLALGLEASRNQRLRGCRPWGLALGWTQSLRALRSGAGHETAAFARPLERGVSPLRRAPCAFLSSLFPGLNEGLNDARKSAAGSIVVAGICRPRQGGRFAADVSDDAGGIGGRGDAKSGHGGWTILSQSRGSPKAGGKPQEPIVRA
jgi:hypothetical protein